MILKYSLAGLLLFGALVLALRWKASVDAAGTNEVLAERVLAAVGRGDYEAFIAEADRSVRKISAEDFRSLADRHGRRLQGGHELRPLDDRWRGRVRVSRWKLIFRDGSSDAVLTLGVRDGKVATFALY